jgi:hypothetical protein
MAQLMSLSSPGTRVWLRQPEHKLDDPGDPVTTALSFLGRPWLLDARLRGHDNATGK